MGAVSRQDLQAARTAQELERKHNFSKSFAEVMGIATDARNIAENANASAEALDKKLSPQEIFNRLTNYGEMQGVFRSENGHIYINAEYITAISELFAGSITMKGKLTYTIETFVEPGDPEMQTIENHNLGIATIPASRIPLYDFNNDGAVTAMDALMGHQASMGIRSLADWAGAKKTPVTLTIDLKNPEKVIEISGVNMWGRPFTEYVGVGGTSLKHIGTADYVVEQGSEIAGFTAWEYRKWNSGLAECYAEYYVGDIASDSPNWSYWAGVNIVNLAPSLPLPSGLFTDISHANVHFMAANCPGWIYQDQMLNTTYVGAVNLAEVSKTSVMGAKLFYTIRGVWKKTGVM